MAEMNHLRDYGLGNPGSPVGNPRLASPEPLTDMACPNCKGETLFTIHVDMENELLRGGMGTGTYVGCAACPWASPMMLVSKEGPCHSQG